MGTRFRHKYKYCLRLREYGLEFDLEYRTYAIPLMSRIDRRIQNQESFANIDNGLTTAHKNTRAKFQYVSLPKTA